MMKHHDVFTGRQLFPINKSEYLEGNDGQFIIYSPLAHDYVEVEEAEMYALKKQLEEKGRFDDNNLQQRLIAGCVTPPDNYVSSPDEAYAMTILPNNICNFSCSYCYAAKGHGQDELSYDTLKTVIDFFVDASRTQRKDLYLSIGGGGEPMISWDKFKYAVEYSDNLAQKQGLKIHYSYASNGSIINEDIISTIKKYNIKANISFDVLEDVQNAQRKNYRKVCETLDLLLGNDIFPTVNAVITPLNVARQCEMVEEVHQRFPQLKRLTFDDVIDSQLFETPDELSQFYDTYTEHFYQARALGKTYGIDVNSIKYHELDTLKSRACGGGFDVTPQGTLSVCFLVSSPKEPLYDTFVYGKITDEGVVYDRDKFKNLVEGSANQREQCRNCFIRWHCGGGCLYNTQSFSKEQMDVLCHFQRRFSLIGLLNKKNENKLSQ